MNRIRSIVSLFLAGLVLIASIGVTVNFHVCAGQIQSLALYIKAQPCKMMMPKACHGEQHSSQSKGCCKDETLVLKGKETNAEVKTATQLTPAFSLIAIILPVLYSTLDLESINTTSGYAHYKPPLIKQDITVLVQSFLI